MCTVIRNVLDPASVVVSAGTGEIRYGTKFWRKSLPESDGRAWKNGIQPHRGPRVYSATNTSDYQNLFLGVKRSRPVRPTT
jgi:hypothetical protein